MIASATKYSLSWWPKHLILTTPRKLATPVNDIATGIFEDMAVHL